MTEELANGLAEEVEGETSMWDSMLETSEMDTLLTDIRLAEFEAERDWNEVFKEPVEDKTPWIDPAGGYHCGTYFSEE
jgi:hypothetical protein